MGVTQEVILGQYGSLERQARLPVWTMAAHIGNTASNHRSDVAEATIH